MLVHMLTVFCKNKLSICNSTLVAQQLLENVPTTRNESTEDVETEVKTILIKNYKVDATCLKNEFDKAHRIGKIKEDNNQTIIIRFKSHGFRSKLYVDRKNHQSQRNNNYKLRVDLTSSRRKLLAEVQDKVKDIKKVAFAFASVNGDIKVRTCEEIERKKVFDISSTSDINELLDKLDCTGALHNVNEQNDVFREVEDAEL